MKYSVLFSFLLFINCYESTVSEYTVKVESVRDGDTIDVLRETEDSTYIERIRIYGIDCPEYEQPFTKEARKFVSDLILGKDVFIEVVAKDKYGRTVAKIKTKDKRYVSEELLKNGLAWHYKRYSNSKKLQDLEDNAKKEKRGIWSDSNAIPPWKWRKKYN